MALNAQQWSSIVARDTLGYSLRDRVLLRNEHRFYRDIHGEWAR